MPPYILGLVSTLLIAGQLADRYTRKPILLHGLSAALVACLLFANVHLVVVLNAARFLSGVAVGVIVSVGIVAVVDPGGPKRNEKPR